jgi:hypothetical protein
VVLPTGIAAARWTTHGAGSPPVPEQGRIDMRKHRSGGALLMALVLVVLVSGTASATSTGIRILAPQLVVQRGFLRFREPAGVEIICNTTLTKTLITEELVKVRPELVKLGKVTSGQFGAGCPATFLGLPRLLGGITGPLPESWDISFLSSNLPGGELNFGILDFQVNIVVPGTMGCLYRGTVLGTLSTDGRILRYAGTLVPLFGGLGCPPSITVSGMFGNTPPIAYVLLGGV